jgi:hypothetical protein
MELEGRSIRVLDPVITFGMEHSKHLPAELYIIWWPMIIAERLSPRDEKGRNLFMEPLPSVLQSG